MLRAGKRITEGESTYHKEQRDARTSIEKYGGNYIGNAKVWLRNIDNMKKNDINSGKPTQSIYKMEPMRLRQIIFCHTRKCFINIGKKTFKKPVCVCTCQKQISEMQLYEKLHYGAIQKSGVA